MLVLKYFFKKIAAKSIMFYYCISISTPVTNISVPSSVIEQLLVKYFTTIYVKSVTYKILYTT